MAANPRMKFGEVGRALGAAWAALSESEKAPYVAESARAREEEAAAEAVAIDLTGDDVTSINLTGDSSAPSASCEPCADGASSSLTNADADLWGRRSKRRAPAAPRRYSPPRQAEAKKRVALVHDNECFACADGGELLECTVCPRVYHLGCANLTQVPKGAFHCPWHSCIECERKSSSVGGTLFHCMTCPLTYCFDCAPDAYTAGDAVRTDAAAATEALLHRRGVLSTKSYLFFHCTDCKTEGRPPPGAPAKHSKLLHASLAAAQPAASESSGEGGDSSDEEASSGEEASSDEEVAPSKKVKVAAAANSKESKAVPEAGATMPSLDDDELIKRLNSADERQLSHVISSVLAKRIVTTKQSFGNDGFPSGALGVKQLGLISGLGAAKLNKLRQHFAATSTTADGPSPKKAKTCPQDSLERQAAALPTHAPTPTHSTLPAAALTDVLETAPTMLKLPGAASTDAPERLVALSRYVDSFPQASARGGSLELLRDWQAMEQPRRKSPAAEKDKDNHTVDIYFVSPTGQKFRSRPEVGRFLSLV